jgi:hypothetical protein
VPALRLAVAEVIKPVQLRNDNVKWQAALETWFYNKVLVLENDSPSDGTLRIVKVDRGVAGGMMYVDRSEKWLNYELNTKNMWATLSFTDTFT